MCVVPVASPCDIVLALLATSTTPVGGVVHTIFYWSTPVCARRAIILVANKLKIELILRHQELSSDHYINLTFASSFSICQIKVAVCSVEI